MLGIGSSEFLSLVSDCPANLGPTGTLSPCHPPPTSRDVSRKAKGLIVGGRLKRHVEGSKLLFLLEFREKNGWTVRLILGKGNDVDARPVDMLLAGGQVASV